VSRVEAGIRRDISRTAGGVCRRHHDCRVREAPPIGSTHTIRPYGVWAGHSRRVAAGTSRGE
jgi:hypothetical protein